MLIESGIGEFSDAQVLTAGTTVSTNVLNLVAARHQVGMTGELWFWIRLNAILGTTAATDTAVITLNNSAVVGMTGNKSIFATSLTYADTDDTRPNTAGNTIWCSTLPTIADKQYLALSYVLTDVGGTVGFTFDAGLSTVRPPSDRTKDQVYQTNVTSP